MEPHTCVITLGVWDPGRAVRVDGEGLGWPMRHARGWVSFTLGDESPALDLVPRGIEPYVGT